ncbi:unnamed protein product [Parascedosporium putredinis]|uniref:Uncharacterized protein n=1 Tax=Parascedosporium putredinis TaxID=1442378 RepID=A0A9P1HCH5_9PEZI|nr:unnamed protein product [Parascedosporium putredinis]CAI8004846.1 unnamed protein product [Parascedosporium putredinis]
MSTLFEPETAQCYTFSCVLNNYSRPSKYLGYEKPGATYPCPADQPIPGEPQNPHPSRNLLPMSTPTTGSQSSPTGSTGGSGGSGSGDAGSGEGSDPAAPTIVLDGSAIKAMAPGSLFVAIGLAMVLFETILVALGKDAGVFTERGFSSR